MAMNSSSASNANTTNNLCGSLPSSTQARDPAWEWGERKDPENPNIITCLLCNKLIRGGGITRLKEHLVGKSGNTSPCPNATTSVINKVNQLFAVKKTKNAHRANIDLAYQRTFNSDEGSDVDTDVGEQEVEIDGNVGSGSGVDLHVQKQTKRKRITQSNTRGPIDLYMRTDHKKTQKVTAERNCAVKEKLLKTAWKCISSWMTENSVAFNTVRCPSFKEMIFAIGDYGKGSVFLKSVDASDRTNDDDFIPKLVKEVIADVGAENVVQFITDNGSNFKKAGKDLMLEYPHMFWTPFGAHCVQLMLEELGSKLPRIKTAVILGKRLVTYIYAHFQVLSLMRELTGADLHRSTKTRFATQYYTLESLQKYKTPLQMVFVNDRWVKTRFARENVGVNALKIVTSIKFWEDVDYSCRVLKPLVKVVRLVDIERKPTMPSFYEAMRIARDQLEKNLGEDNDTWLI
ncbi:uncharacterized protein LOC113324988 [Papaver somniferum]|uniref:uncharacterized protein LOC113324988 n=1 Tax=Papaver somniferum TaxID=3469 RepID=UPI000E705D14|nr:uncharacterized protein LOC113324988 [Papaver somniferum]